MVTQMKDFNVSSESSGMFTYVRNTGTHLSTLTRILGVCTAVVVCGVGADVAYHQHVMGFYVTAASGLIFFLEITWAITLFVQICVRNDESLCSCCWSAVLAITRGWRRALFYLPLSCILAWKPYSLWLSYVAAGLLAVLSLLHITSSALGIRGSCQMSNATDSVGESLLNTRPENYDRFEEVLIECIAQGDGSTGRRCVWTNRTSGRQRWGNMTRTSALMGKRIRRG
ncbi:uncharacterized protein LOC102677788 isoform X1 [Apis dorsata]|uniref:uncharacterized protein LOC102677788 isoform X1 n=1 Tax=Apis dorsata TaxID=7462 RepID=UPI0003DF646D|nr:uncharacterized protein LOC102677788 isoform X1 [Apis dorsata]